MVEEHHSLCLSKWEKFFRLEHNDFLYVKTSIPPMKKGRRLVELSERETKQVEILEDFIDPFTFKNQSFEQKGNSMQSLKSHNNTQTNLSLPGKTLSFEETINMDQQDSNMDSFQKPYNEDLYSFIPLKCYMDEVPNKLFFFNERVEPPLNQCFYTNFSLLSKELLYYNQEGYYYITSHLTEKVEGMIIYASLNPYEIDIFYLASSQKTSFKEIVQFVIQRMQNLLGINKFKMRVMHTKSSMGKLGVDPFIKDTLNKLGFKINSIVNSPPPGKKYSVFIYKSSSDVCMIQKSQPGFKLSC